MWAERPRKALREALQEHFTHNHQSQLSRYEVYNQSFEDRPNNVKPLVHGRHSDVFDSLYPVETSLLNLDNKAPQSEFVLNTTEQTPRKVEGLSGLPNTPAFQPFTGTVPGALPEQSTKVFSSQGLSPSSIFYWQHGTTQGSDDSGYSSVGHRDNITKSTQECIHSRHWQRGYYEKSFYGVPGGFSLGADETRTSRASSVETSEYYGLCVGMKGPR